MKRSCIGLIVFSVLVVACSKKIPVPVSDTVAASPAPAPAAAAPVDELAAARDQIGGAIAKEREALRQALVAKAVTADPEIERAWSQFRAAYPYHIQEIAMSAPANGTRTVIVAEPPPNVALDDLLTAVAPNLVAYEVKKQPIGYDGWVKDVVFRISGDDSAASTIASRLTATLFQTSYKAHILPLPPHLQHAKLDLDLYVTPAEVQKWIFTDQEFFLPVLGGRSVPAADVFANQASTVYFSRNRGLVGWWIPKGAEIDSLAAEARQFSLDSDLIVGAVGHPSGVLVLGRERAVALDDLPPLRFETMALFAAVTGSARAQLEQSYERSARFAGAIGQGRDWAPIHLSPELVDTEYGSLLNITDQLLKGWSNAGQTRYVNFHYPQPKSFPFPAALPKVLPGNGSLTYNWNTTGVGYTVAAGDHEIFALYRTGALPTSYIPEGVKRSEPAVLSAEEKGYRYFAGLQDPNLIRVVQYASLYQIFTTFEVSGTSSLLRSNELPRQTRQRFEQALMEEIENASESQLDQMAGELAGRVAVNSAERMPNKRVDIDGTAEMLRPSIRSELDAVRAGSLPTTQMGSTARLLALSAFADHRQLPQQLAKAVGEKADGWIHTPVVVMSNNHGDLQSAVGGHNLYSEVTRVEVSGDVARGLPQVTAEGRLRINPADEPKARELIRIAARDAKGEMEASEIAADLQRMMRRIPGDVKIRPVLQALKLHAGGPGGRPPRPPYRGRSLHDHGDGSGWGMNFGSSGQPPESGLFPGAVVIERRQDRTIRIVFDGDREAHAANAEDATDAVVHILKRDRAGNDDGAVRMVMRGFDSNDGRSFVESCNLRSKAADAEMSGFIAGERMDPAAVAEIMSRRYDWSNATVKGGDLSEVGGRRQATLVIDIPRQDADGTARTAVTVAFHSATPELVAKGLIARITESIRRILKEKKESLNVFVFNTLVSREVKAFSRKIGLPIEIIEHQFVDAMHDLFFVEVTMPHPLKESDEERRRPA
jgi:hypothetical protein